VLLRFTCACCNVFGKIIKVSIFSKENPLSSLSVVAALNQLIAILGKQKSQ
jgi:hypothetical protein